MLIPALAICGWIAVLAIVAALAAAAARGDEALAAALDDEDRRRSTASVLRLEWSGPPLFAVRGSGASSRADVPGDGARA